MLSTDLYQRLREDVRGWCPVLVKAVAGARWGATVIPPELLRGCGLMIRVRTVAERLANQWEEKG